MLPYIAPRRLRSIAACCLALAATAACEDAVAPSEPATDPSALIIGVVPIGGTYYLPAFPDISVGAIHSCAIRKDWVVLCWGNNIWGQLGNGAVTPRMDQTTPVQVRGNILFKAVTTAGNATCALDRDGRPYCWGLGWGLETGTGPDAGSSVPVAVPGGLTFKAISGTCGLTSAGWIYCWTDRRSLPTRVESPYGDNFKSVSMGGSHVCAVTTYGLGMCWGNNDWGQLGNGTSTSSSVPSDVGGGYLFRSIQAGRDHSCGVTTTYVGVCWGLADNGRLGVDQTALQYLPGGSYYRATLPVRAGGDSYSFHYIDAGTDHSCGIRKLQPPADTSRRDAYCWGKNDFGQLGIGGRSSPTSRFPTPLLVSDQGTAGFSTINAGLSGSGHSCGINRTGNAYCWGLGEDGQIGDGSTGIGNYPASPRLVEGGHSFSW